MKLWYLYTRHNSMTMSHAMTDGHFDLLDYMLREKIVDEADAIIENYALKVEDEPKITAAGVRVRRLPAVQALAPQLGDVVWIRGGWKAWLPWVREMKAKGIWFLYYDAATGHRNWPDWDVVLSDLIREHTQDGQGRALLRYPKPVAEMFRYRQLPIQYDVMLGSSHIYDRKGQFYAYRAVLAYERKYGVKLRAALSGGWYVREDQTVAMRNELPQHPNVVYLGHVPREQLVDLYNSTRLYVGTAIGGYGNRGPIEAGSCGCPQIMGYPKNNAPWSYDDSRAGARVSQSMVVERHKKVQFNADILADEIHEMLTASDPAIHPWLSPDGLASGRAMIAAYFHDVVGIPVASGPLMRQLFGLFRTNYRADPLIIREAFL